MVHDLMTLGAGVYLGFLLTALVHVAHEMRTAARTAEAAGRLATAALKRTRGDAYLAGFLIYKLTHRRTA
ncbi:hypothetical protein AB0890_12650 [Streptomyces sp. NPDC005406]|uniref:hypothetical protein n=1 Tax=Streptomyces sp. NPDC005406 TaxID=3155339 RepID=UPI00345146F4